MEGRREGAAYSANRYVIQRESFQVDILVTWLGKWICLDRMDYFGMVFGERIRLTVPAQVTIPV